MQTANMVGWISCALAAALLLDHAGTEAFTVVRPLLVGSGARRARRPFTSAGAPAGSPSTRAVAPTSDDARAATLLQLGFVRPLSSKTAGTIDEEGFELTMQRLMRTLENDLPTQYERPQDLSIFGDNVEFRDPVTTLRGKLPYRGMLFFTLMFFRVACKPGSSYFEVTAIDRPARKVIRTVWRTGATTLNGRNLFISGVDTFTVGEDGRISRHDSSWDQTWEQVQEQLA